MHPGTATVMPRTSGALLLSLRGAAASTCPHLAASVDRPHRPVFDGGVVVAR
jgi:hypothetical protein